MLLRPQRSAHPRLALGLALGLVFLGGGGCHSAGMAREEMVVSAVQHGRYAEALEEAQRLVDENPGDGRFQALYLQARIAHVLDQGRKAVFRGDLDQALELFQQAHELDPAHEQVEAWIAKTHAQLADEWLDRASEVSGPDRLKDAELAYEKVLEYDPDNLAARRGLGEVLLLTNYRSGQSKTYFDDGMSTFRGLLLQQARRSFMVSRRYKENEPATVRGEQTEKLLAEERLRQAEGLEAAGLYFAARNEYRLVLLIDPTNAAGREGLDRMDRESRATSTLSKADMEIRRGAVEKARKTLDGAELLTSSQQDHITLLRNDIDDRGLEEIYVEAEGLIKDNRFPEAVQVFDRLLAINPDYKDAAALKSTIEEFIRYAEEFYAQALAAPDDAAAETILRKIQVVWPEYRDIAERLAAIEARKPAEPAPEAPAAEDEGSPR